MGIAQDGKRNGDRQPSHRLNINFGSISLGKSINYLNRWRLITFGQPMGKKQQNKYFSKENPKFV